MTRNQFYNLLLLVSRAAQANPRASPFLIACNLGKLQRLAVSLHNAREKPREISEYLENKAIKLGEELGFIVTPTRKPWGETLTIGIEGIHYAIY